MEPQKTPNSQSNLETATANILVILFFFFSNRWDTFNVCFETKRKKNTLKYTNTDAYRPIFFLTEK